MFQNFFQPLIAVRRLVGIRSLFSSALATLVVQNSHDWGIIKNTSGWISWFFFLTFVFSPTTVFFDPGNSTRPEFARLGDYQKYIRVIFVIFLFFIFVFLPTTISSALATLVVQNLQDSVIVKNTSVWSAWFSLLMFFSSYLFSSALATLVVQNSQDWVIVKNTSGRSTWFSLLMFLLLTLPKVKWTQALSVLTQSTVFDQTSVSSSLTLTQQEKNNFKIG